MLIFDGAVLDTEQLARLRVPPRELHGFALCTLGEATRLLWPLLARRVAALRAGPSGLARA